MTRDDIQKLLGGYATGTLTPDEQQALFEAALTDQELFDALAREDALREVLSDRSARAQLLAALEQAPAPWYRAWWRPMVVMAAAAAVVVTVAVYTRAPEPTQVAKVELPRFSPAPAPPPQTTPVLPAPPEVRPAARAEKPLPVPAPQTPAPPPPQAAPQPSAPMSPRAAASPPATAQSSGSLNGVATGSLGGAGGSREQARARLESGDSLLPRAAAVQVRGTVTDTTGAAIPSADVVLKSLLTGESAATSTDDRGEFTATAAPGSLYQISASKPGFQTATLRDEAPVNGAPAPVKIKLDVGASTQAVEVTGAAPRTMMMTHTGARASLKAKLAAPPAITYHLLRAVPDGEPVEVPAGGTAPVGSSLTLRITPVASGYLRIMRGDREIASPKVRRGVVVETAVAADTPGPVELQVYFSETTFEKKRQLPPTLTIAFQVQ